MSSRFEASRRNNFNALRLLFATSVLLSHAFELVDGNRGREPLTRLFGTLSLGEVAVDSFFLLSGYLIAQSWMNSDGIVDFIRKRALRIYPGFVVASAISVLLIGPMAAGAVNYFGELNLPKFVLELVLLFEPKTPPVFAGDPYPVVNGSMWSITYEFRCYLLIALAGTMGILRRRRIFFTIAISVMAISVGRDLPVSWIASHASSGEFPRLVAYFLSGACFYLFKDMVRYDARLAILAAALLCVSLLSKAASGPAYAILGGYLLFYVAFADIDALKIFRSSSDISYGVYLYGWPIQKIIIWQYPGWHPLACFAVSVLCSYSAGYISWRLVEKPFLRLKRGTARITAANIRVSD
jgi:peptidoglycan/LPS O-acetylase OafA/YrhL